MMKKILSPPNIDVKDAVKRAWVTDATVNVNATDNGATLDDIEDQNAGNNTGDGSIGGSAPNKDDDDPEEYDYYPESKEDLSLGPKEYDIPKELLDEPRLRAFRRWLINTTKSRKKNP